MESKPIMCHAKEKMMIKSTLHDIIKEQSDQKQTMESNAKKSQRKVIIFFVVLLACIFLFLDLEVALILGFFVGGTGIIVWALQGSSMFTLEKMSFLIDLAKHLQNETYPQSKIQYELDTSNYMVAEKKTWEGRSAHGNPKIKYTDNWFKFRCMLMDLSELRISLRSKYKHKKGICVGKKIYLIISFAPNTKLYRVHMNEDMKYLETMVIKKMEDDFPDSDMECSAMDVSTEEKPRFKLKIQQQERPYSITDIYKVLVGIYALLQKRMLPSGSPQ